MDEPASIPKHFLYVIASVGATVGPVKLGISSNPARRLKQLQTGHVEPLQCYHSEPIDATHVKSIEYLLHRDVGYKRLRGEWFALTVEEAIGHIGHTIIRYIDIDDLAYKVKKHYI